jgi:uncharacterized protein (DUF2345 family)
MRDLRTKRSGYSWAGKNWQNLKMNSLEHNNLSPNPHLTLVGGHGRVLRGTCEIFQDKGVSDDLGLVEWQSW